MTLPAIAGSGRKTETVTAAEHRQFFNPAGDFDPQVGVGVSGFFFSEILMKKITQSRLAKLPPKVAMPLTHLAKIGQMKEQDIKTVLDAGDLTGNHNMLVGFAAGAMGMKAQQGVPVTDTVAMAKRLAAERSVWTGALAAGTRNMTGWRKLSHCDSSAKRT